MANRPKPQEQQMTKRVQAPVTEAMFKDIDQMAQEMGITTADRIRRCLEQELQQWRKSRNSKASK